ncbi:deoxyguanosinetriphosphate triphosphohydrolase family protein [Actinosynnema sp. CS-041913]|uniref:deoxyguanosinetriphosphate triphosphohydrolase family protein n=1 Tax=Actinosynnema sp. CS-041913 TaxID=3239917 RepID=UPI003D8D5670
MTLDQRRRHQPDTAPEYRTAFQRDRDRVLYSSAFRRLAGVTQVAAVSEQRVLHNRLTHSLKVAQLGRRAAQHLVAARPDLAVKADVDPDVVETAGLAHDLGHPPFGHVAEVVLDSRLGDTGLEGFEGNAQSFRIVTKLARRSKGHPGLDLTPASLNAILKYPTARPRRYDAKAPAAHPWTDRSRGPKWGCYLSELPDFVRARGGCPPKTRCANAVLMDWADDITYATHDIEDYFRAGLIPLHDLTRNSADIRQHGIERLKDNTGFDQDEFVKALDRVLEQMNGRQHRSHSWETRENRAWLNGVTSANLTDLIGATEESDDWPYLAIDRGAQYTIEALKELTWFYVIDKPALAMAQEGQKRIIGSLYDRLFERLSHDPSSRKLPTLLQEMYQDAVRDPDANGAFATDEPAACARAVVDYLCVLTEGQAIDLDERLSGTTRNSMFGVWFH